MCFASVASPADGHALAVRRRHTLDRGDGGRIEAGHRDHVVRAGGELGGLAGFPPRSCRSRTSTRSSARGAVPSSSRRPRKTSSETLEALDGIVFSGGADVDPARYGAEAHPETDTPQARRDAGEMALLRAALERDMPTLAICRGFQLLNVARGGDLVQHLPEQSGTTRTSRCRASSPFIPVEVKEGSRLASIVGATLRRHVASPPGARSGGRRARRDRVGRGRDARGGRGSRRCASPSAFSGTRRRARTRRSSRRSSSRRASTARHARSRLAARSSTGGSRVLHLPDHLHRPVRRLHRGRAATAGDGALGRRARRSGSWRSCSSRSSRGSCTGSGG